MAAPPPKAQAKAIQNADAAFAKAAAKAWTAKAKAYMRQHAPIDAQPTPEWLVPPAVAAPQQAAADPIAKAGAPLEELRGYPYLAKAARFVHPENQPLPGYAEPDVDGRLRKSRKIASAGVTAGKVFSKACRELNHPDARLHLYPEQTAADLALAVRDVNGTIDAHLRSTFQRG
eukprot:GEMP01056157.1.p1 GENE.GEMP01056157.1~~GEMP01056157.1.p1  ORF type:complete len:185 (+),score=30.28 GEMP01056157.1:36-557(+)